jgi:bis(5'-nucleosidyl)-tetraphosphatase
MKVNRRSAGIVIVRPFDAELRCLLLRCYAYWDFPKGEVEAGEDPLATARREVREETGLRDLGFPWGCGFVETPPYGKGKVARYYLAQSTQGDVELPVSPELGIPEHHEYRWVSFEEGRSLVNDRIRAVLDWAESRASAPTDSR